MNYRIHFLPAMLLLLSACANNLVKVIRDQANIPDTEPGIKSKKTGQVHVEHLLAMKKGCKTHVGIHIGPVERYISTRKDDFRTISPLEIHLCI
ncbi:MAG: hypothetical protein P1P82_05425 [Bacteroidales bacterium]|nr:hypothetical protein [Bacteroidales bacterium]MDT8431426.1 hypothetical protein [Bacteroidales bacterium]